MKNHIFVPFLVLLIAACASPRRQGRKELVGLVSYASAFLGKQEADLESELIRILADRGIKSGPEAVRATSVLVVKRTDYIVALAIILDAVREGELPEGKLYLHRMDFWYYDEEEKMNKYDWEAAKIESTRDW